MSVKETKQMNKVCKHWNNKAGNLHVTKQQCHDHFKEYYDDLKDEDEQLESGGINVVLQQTQDALQDVRQQLDQQNAKNAIILAKLLNIEQQHKDNASVISGLCNMRKFNASRQSQTNALQGLIAQMQKQCMSAEASGGNPDFQPAGESTGGKRQVMTWFGQMKTIVEYDLNKRRKSDGKSDKRKEKYYKHSNDYCW